MIMNRFISKQTAILSKELGFHEKCIYYYYKNNTYLENEWSDGAGYGVEIDNLLFDYNGMYTDRVSAPLQSSLQKWLREKHGIWVSVHDDYHMSKNIPCISYKVTTYGNTKEHCGYSKEIHQGLPYKYLKPEDYHKVLESGLFKALEILKNRK